MDTTTMTPREVDTVLAGIWQREMPHISRIGWMSESLRNPRTPENRRMSLQADIDAERAELAKLEAEAKPYNDEYNLRRWNRYFLVTAGGHVHRGRNCTTCYATTQYGWLPELSGCDESEMVREYGETACTVCFPEAPTMWKAMGSPKGKLAREAQAAKDARAAKRAEAERKRIEKGITNPDGSRLKGRNWSIDTLAAAKREVVETAASIKHSMPGSYNYARMDELKDAFERIAAAIAHKTGADVNEIKKVAEARAAKRGY